MKQPVQDALADWWAGLTIGVIPIIAHTISHFAVKRAGGMPDGNWTVDVVFIVMSTSGTSMVTACGRLLKMLHGTYEGPRLGHSFLMLIAITSVIIASAAILYGAVASGQPSDYALFLALGLAIASLLTSIYVEMTLASKEA